MREVIALLIVAALIYALCVLCGWADNPLEFLTFTRDCNEIAQAFGECVMTPK